MNCNSIKFVGENKKNMQGAVLRKMTLYSICTTTSRVTKHVFFIKKDSLFIFPRHVLSAKKQFIDPDLEKHVKLHGFSAVFN